MRRPVSRMGTEAKAGMLRNPRLFSPLVFTGFLANVAASTAVAGDFKYSVALGYGGTGITSIQTIKTVKTPVQRSESPGTFALTIDYLLSERFTLMAEHLRGFRLGPLSSGTAFTGIGGRWYFLRPVPAVTLAKPEGSSILIKRFEPFFGLMSGIAGGSITRDNDTVPVVEGSGLFFGYHFGADYPLSRGVGIRPEIAYLTTWAGPATLTAFSFQCGLTIFP